MKMLHSGFRSYDERDGLTGHPVVGFFEDLQGHVHAVNGRSQEISRLEDGAFSTVEPNYGVEVINLGMRRGQIAYQDRRGEWWFATYNGLFRFGPASRIEDLQRRRPAAIYTEKNGLTGHRIARVFEDSRGDIWIAMGSGGLNRWDRRSQSFQRFSTIPEFQHTVVNAFAEDRSGHIWIASNDRLAVYRYGNFQFFGRRDGLPGSPIQCVLIDRAGRLWFGTEGDGLARVDQPDATQWGIRLYTTADHLSSNSIECLVEDSFGRIYVGTAGGMDRLEPQSNRVRAYGLAEGFARGLVRTAYRDRQGHLWFGTTRGASELVPSIDDSIPPMHVSISGIRAGGRRFPISELGETAIPRFTLNPQDTHLEIALSSISTGSDGPVKFRYRLSPSSANWTSPSSDRVINLVGLASGAYRLEVKAVANDGHESPIPATAEFVILSPMWTRWWFIALSICLSTAFAAWLHRRRLQHALDLERVRTRIATDLHDDVGASLSQIAILSEVANQGHHNGANHVSGILQEIAGTARELVDSMSDIVWAIDPEHDHVDDLSFRMRRFSEDLCLGSGISLTFRAPQGGNVTADAHLRREVYLILKESLHNAIRHSGCTEACVVLQIEGQQLCLTVSDNGLGFDPVSSRNGHGLKSMRDRAIRLGGTIDWQPGLTGTSVVMRVPLAAPRVRTA